MSNNSIIFEYDSKKSEANREKHRIGLGEAKELWLAIGVEVKARTVDEPRFLRIGKLKGKLYSCVYTVRGNAIRLISVRRSRDDEAELYEKRIQNEERAADKEN